MRYEVRERNGHHGVWDQRLLRWEALAGGQDVMDELDAEFLAAELNAAAKYDSGIPAHEDWVLLRVGNPDQVVNRGSEKFARSVGEGLIMTAETAEHAAVLYADLYLERPDGSHESFDAGDGTFVLGERPTWIEVDW